MSGYTSHSQRESSDTITYTTPTIYIIVQYTHTCIIHTVQ